MSEFYSVNGQDVFPVINLRAEGMPTLYYCKIPATAVDMLTGVVSVEHVIKVEGAARPNVDHYFYDENFCQGLRYMNGLFGI